MKLREKKETGFSLLELSVAVGVSAIVATAGIVATTAFIGSAQDKRDSYTTNANSAIANAEASSLALGASGIVEQKIVPSTDKAATTTILAGTGETVLGTDVTVSASGLKPGAAYTIVLQSKPVTLASGTVPTTGILSETVTIPADTATGWHSITLTSTYYDDTALSNVQWLEIAGDGTLGETILPAPGDVIDFYAVSKDYNSANMVWTASSNGGPVDNYLIIVGGETVATLDSSATSYTVQGLPSNTTTSITIRAVNDGGESAVTSNVTTDERIVLAGWGSDGSSRITGGSIYSDLVDIDAGSYHSIGLRADGTVVGWGNSSWSAVPLGDNDLPITATAISASSNHTWVVREDGSATVWGESKNEDNVGGHTNLVDISTNGNTAVGLTNAGTVVMLGGIPWLNPPAPLPPASLTNVTKAVAGNNHYLALKSDGTIVGWGSNNCGQITIPSGLNNVIDIAAGSCYSVAVKSDGTVVVWGETYASDAFDGDTNVPAGLSDVVAVDASMVTIVALKSDGTVVVWGNDYAGQPAVPQGTSNVTHIAAGDYHVLTLQSE